MAFTRLPGKNAHIYSNGTEVCLSEWSFTLEGEDKPIVTFCSPRDTLNNLIREHNISVVNGTIAGSGYMDGGLNPHGAAVNINVGATGTVKLVMSDILNLFYQMPVLCQRWKTSVQVEDSVKFECSWLLTGTITFPSY